VTIIDTPGQDIFYRMRNYGVSVADMVLLVVSLEDGVSIVHKHVSEIVLTGI
jgi:translation initiation factor IF-2